MLSKIDHIAIAVTNIESAIPLWEALLGTACYKTEEVTGQLTKTAFFNVAGVKIELLAGTTTESTVSRFIERDGEGLHHVAFSTEDLDTETMRLESLSFTPIGKTQIGAESKRIRFLKPSGTSGALIELCEEKR